jgi:ectoine hydroxylase-related dioxygenase (phytanoyl-CoA dioxygenase family)
MITDEQRGFFAEHGWVIVRGVVSPERAAALEAALDQVVMPASYVAWGERIVEVAGISHASPELAAAIRDPAIAGIAGALLDAGRVQLLQDTALVKPARGDATLAWHQDFSYLTYLDRPGVVTARLALTPCTDDSGCLRVIDGSHRWGGLHGDDLAFRLDAVADTLDALPAELRARARDAERLVELEPGDVSVHHCLTFHGSGKNRGDRTRKTLAVRYLDGAARLVPERLPEHLRTVFTADDDGHLTGPWFPQLWQRG